jgi:hypothetical protein
LWEAEGSAVHDSIGPGVTSLLKFGDQEFHRGATVEVQHEGDILKKNPFRGCREIKQAEQFRNEAGLRTADACCLSRLTQVLAGKSGTNYLCITERTKRPYIRHKRHSRESFCENKLRRRVDFAEDSGNVAGTREAKFYAADARKQSGNSIALTSFLLARLMHEEEILSSNRSPVNSQSSTGSFDGTGDAVPSHESLRTSLGLGGQCHRFSS